MAGSLQRTRGFRLEKVKAEPGSDSSKPTVYKFRANDGDFDRYQDRLSVSGWKLDAFNANPVILYNHDAGDGGFLGLGSKDVLPIGKGRAYVEGAALMVDIEFDPDDEFARKVEGKVQKGILNAVSVRYTLPADSYEENEKGGLDSTAQELLEISIVTIPGNQRALRVKGLEDLDALFDTLIERRRAHNPKSSTHGDTMTPEQIAAMMKQAADNAAITAIAALEAKQKADADAKARLEADKAAKDVEKQALKDEIRAEIMGAAQGQRGVPVQFSETVKVGEKASKGSGIDFARYVKAQWLSKADLKPMLESLKHFGFDDAAAKALSSGTFAGGGALIQSEISSDFIELLRNETVVRKAGARVVPLKESLGFNGQASASSAAWGTETEEIAKSDPQFNRPLNLTPKKLRALSVIPNDLMRATGADAEKFVRDDLLRVAGLAEDTAFLYGTGTSSQPLGIAKSESLLAAHVYAMTALGAAGVPTTAEVKKELRKALKRFKLSNAPGRDIVWIMSPSIEAAICQAVGPGGEGANQIELEYSSRGTMMGKRAYVTNQVPETSTADFLAFDMSEVIIGDAMGIEVEVFPNGTWSESGTAKSGISLDQSVIRLIKKTDIGLRHNVSGVKVTGMTWGI